MKFDGVLAANVKDVWPVIKDLVEEAIAAGTRDEEPIHVLASLLSRNAQLWLALDGAQIYGIVITRYISRPNRDVLELAYCAGRDIERWAYIGEDVLSRYAKSIGCKSLDVVGRPGWGRFFKLGKPVLYIYRKEL